MKIITDFENNIIPNAYTKHAGPEGKIETTSIVSFPFQIEDIPSKAKYLHLALVDHDSIPVAGFSFIHWTVANISANQTSFPKNWSRDDSKKIQGVNSYSSRLLKQFAPHADLVKNNYIGPGAPDKDHEYEFVVFATINKLNLKNGFFLNDFKKQLRNNYLEKTKIYLIGKK